MSAPAGVPPLKEFSPSMRVDVFISDWRAGLEPEIPGEEKERQLYGLAWEAYLDGDYGFGLWCWHECDRLTNNMNGNVREVTRIVGAGRYFGFSHRRAVAAAVPVERIYRPRKGDMSTPRTDAFVLPHYQVLCVYLVRAESGDPKARAQLEIALLELEERRRADPFLRYFEMFRDLLKRTSTTSTPSTAAPTPLPTPDPPTPAVKASRPPRAKSTKRK
jgi:hypothetical protein